jgi:inositol oxygenase
MANNYRNYKNSQFQRRVENTYKLMLENQTVEYVKQMKEKYETLWKRMAFWDVVNTLEKVHDQSDPDNNLPQIYHAYQTAQSARKYVDSGYEIRQLFSEREWEDLPKKYQEKFTNQNLNDFYDGLTTLDWFPLLGFIHDLGKILSLKEFGNLPQWSVVGDTFPVGEGLDNNYEFFVKGYHLSNSSLNGEKRCYTYGCGFDNVLFSYGHDEFLARVLEKNKTKLPNEAIYIIRYHSFYSWHTPRTGIRGYRHLANEHDWHMLPLLKAFQKSDLYSKTRDIPNLDEIKEIVKRSLEKYFETEILEFGSPDGHEAEMAPTRHITVVDHNVIGVEDAGECSSRCLIF